MENTMTNEEILAEFEELFGGSEESEETPPNEPEVEDEASEEEAEEETATEGQQEPEEDSTAEEKKRTRQAHAFAAMRTQNKAQEQLIKNLGALLGFDAKATNDDIVAKVQEVLTEKQAKEQNIPVEILNRLQELEKQIEETETIKLETKLTEDLATIAEKFDLDEAALTEFLFKLDELGKNPLENKGIDLYKEYITLNFDQLMENARQSALDTEQARKEKLDRAPGTLPGKTGSEESEGVIKSVGDLDKLFNSMDI